MTFDHKGIPPKSITSPEEIKSHLIELYYLQIPLVLSIENKIELPDSYLIFTADLNMNPVIKTRPVRIIGGTDIDVYYSNLSRSCHFSAGIRSQTETSGHYSLIHIDSPQSISCIERRTYLRVKPAEADNVQIECSFNETGPVRLPVSSISGGGLSFQAPDTILSLDKGMKLELSVLLPGLKLDCSAVVVNITSYLKIKRAGVTFLHISESDRAAILRYVFQKQRDEKQQDLKPAGNADEKQTILIWTQDNVDKYHFLEEKYALTIRNTPASFAIPAHSTPDLVILDMGAECSGYLENLTKDQMSNFFPILIIGIDPMEIDNSIESIKTIPPPFTDHFVLRIVGDLLYKARLSKKLAGLDWAESKTDHKTILVFDIFQNINPSTFSYMQKIGFNVVLMEGEDDLLIRSIRSKPDLILMDEQFEKTDLLSLCKLMSMNKKLLHIPKLLVAESMKNGAELIAGNLISDVLIRPYSEEDLISKINELFNKDNQFNQP